MSRTFFLLKKKNSLTTERNHPIESTKKIAHTLGPVAISLLSLQYSCIISSYAQPTLF